MSQRPELRVSALTGAQFADVSKSTMSMTALIASLNLDVVVLKSLANTTSSPLTPAGYHSEHSLASSLPGA